MAVRLKGSTPTPPPTPISYDPWDMNRDYRDTSLSYTGEGIGALGAGLGNFYLDAGRNTANFLETLGNFFSAQPQAVENQGWGNRLFGQPMSAARPGKTMGKNTHTNSQDQGQQLPEGMTFMDYLALAQALGGGGGVDYRPLMDSARRNQAQGDARLSALYNRLQGEIAGDRPGIQQTFGNATQSVGQAGTDTRDLINAAYDSAAQQRTQQLSALGIEDAALRDNFTAGDQAAAIARSAERQNISQNQLGSDQATALNYNTQIGEATGQQGAEMRAALERALYDRLAELETAQSESNSQSQNNVFNMAFQMASNPTMFDPRAQVQAANQQDFENQLAAQKFALDQYKAQGSQQTILDALNMLPQIQGAAQQYGIGDDPESFKNFIDMLNAINR